MKRKSNAKLIEFGANGANHVTKKTYLLHLILKRTSNNCCTNVGVDDGGKGGVDGYTKE